MAIHCAIVSQIMLFFTYANDVYTLASSSLLVTLKPVLLLRGHSHPDPSHWPVYSVTLFKSGLYCRRQAMAYSHGRSPDCRNK